MESLRLSLGLESFAQRDPLFNTKIVNDMFSDLLANNRLGVMSQIFRSKPVHVLPPALANNNKRKQENPALRKRKKTADVDKSHFFAAFKRGMTNRGSNTPLIYRAIHYARWSGIDNGIYGYKTRLQNPCWGRTVQDKKAMKCSELGSELLEKVGLGIDLPQPLKSDLKQSQVFLQARFLSVLERNQRLNMSRIRANSSEEFASFEVGQEIAVYVITWKIPTAIYFFPMYGSAKQAGNKAKKSSKPRTYKGKVLV